MAVFGLGLDSTKKKKRRAKSSIEQYSSPMSNVNVILALFTLENH